MKKIFITLFVSMLAILNGFSQVNINVATVSGTAGQTANVPVTISGIDGGGGGTPVIGIQINVTYLTSVVSYLEIVNKNATLTTAGTWTTSTANGGTIVVLWDVTDLGTPVSLPDGSTLFEIKFINNNGGTSPLTLVNIEVLDGGGNPLPTNLTNGSITYGAPASVTTWNGTGVWYTPANWDNGLPGISTHAIVASGVVTIDAATAYTKNLTINAGAGVTLNSTKVLSVNGNLVLESNATQTATGSFLINGSYTVTGTTTVKRYLTGGIQHFISIPVTAATIQSLYNPANPGYLFRFLEPTSTWENPWLLTYQLALATGYSVNYNTAETISITCPLNNDAAYTPTITRTPGFGWNLVGNPYAAPLDWELGASGWTKTNLDSTYYVWNSSVYASYNSTTGVGVNGGTQFIPQFQGFFVHSSSGTPAFSAKKGARTQAGNGTPYMKDAIANVFRLSISNGTLAEETAVCLVDGASADFDPAYDAYKLFGFNQEAPHIYTMADNIEYAINSQPMADAISLPVVVRTSQAGSFNFVASGFETFSQYYFFILEDAETGINYDLKKTSNLILNLGEGEISGRFTLRIFKSSLGIGDNELNSVRIYSENKVVCFENCPESQVYVYNVVGAIVASQQFEEASLNRMVLNVPAGIYVVKMTTDSGIISSKVFIK